MTNELQNIQDKILENGNFQIIPFMNEMINMVDNARNKVAVLIDADNIPASAVEKILLEAKKFGEVVIQRAYGDFIKLNSWREVSKNNAINIIQTPEYIKKKNTADGVMIIDAMKICFQNKIDCFCICSSDSDFTHLAITVKELGKKVYGFGNQTTNKSLIATYNQFIYIETLDNTLNTIKILSKKEKEILKKIYEQSDKEFLPASTLSQKLQKFLPDFNPKNYGCCKFGDFVKKHKDILEYENRTSDLYVKLKSIKQN
ncbi:NYN domain-containing protein [Campylobacter sp. JMF_06 NA1]|uniref:NYN domain-containing protein n=1 Tax=Campylobacter sp. JMF_06 NA1 TaxID=2983823 RepID=UPI0022E9B3C1|nr:NYN domain-containing protein [Campylobacter sp. JMF_06 NA1]MDA3078392.1 NYN domain-containing protein [Campylobacter sp. JMF_06 NA1]